MSKGRWQKWILGLGILSAIALLWPTAAEGENYDRLQIDLALKL